jgi:tripartite-type tricarboxylate transporter receptor subunit TctC
MTTASIRAIVIAAFSTFVFAASEASAAYPERPIHIVVPFPAGGGVDVLARLVGDELAKLLGQAVVVDNKPGADTQIGSTAVAQAAPDGYTLGFLTSTLGVNKALYPNLPYNALKDFTPIAGIASAPFYLVVNPALGVKDVAGLVARAKTAPGKLNYSSSSSDVLLAGEIFKKAYAIDTVRVPYRGTPPALLAVLSGEVSYSFFTLVGIKPQVDAGRLRVLAITTPQRSRKMADVPTLAESGAPGFDIAVWFGVLGPAGLPPAITAKLNTAINQIVAVPAVRQRIESLGAAPLRQTPREFASFMAADFTRYVNVVGENRLHPDH